MPDTKISALTAASSLGDTDELVLASAGTSKKITGANLKASMPASGALTLLSTTTLGAAAAFDVSSISGAYNDLIVVAMLRCNVALSTVNPALRFNNDSGSNYGYERQSITSTTTTTQDSGANTSLDFGTIPAANNAAGLFAAVELVIPGYASTTWKKIVAFRTHWALDVTTTNKQMYQGMGFWNSTAAINRIQLPVSNADTTWAIGSQLRIYGRA